jgi:hypothetical protein
MALGVMFEDGQLKRCKPQQQYGVIIKCYLQPTHFAAVDIKSTTPSTLKSLNFLVFWGQDVELH